MQNKKWLAMLLSLVVSVGIWVYIVTVENPERDQTLYNIPVVFTGEDILREDYDLIISESNVASGVTLTFYGKNSELNKLLDDKMELEVEIDVSRLRSATEFSFSYDMSDITLPASVSNQSITLTGKSPTKITVTLDQLAKKTVPVEVITDVKVMTGYLAERVTQDMSEIVIEGPAELVNNVDHAVVTLKRENVDQTITASLPYTLVDLDGNTIESTEITSDVNEIQVTLPVYVTRELRLTMDFQESAGARLRNVDWEIEPRTILVSGPAEVLDNMDSIVLDKFVLADMGSATNYSYAIPVPEGCENLSGVTRATLHISFKDMLRTTVGTSNFQLVNEPEGRHVTVQTARVAAIIFGTTEDVSAVTEEDVVVAVDLKDFGSAVGTYTVPAVVTVPGHDVGVSGTYQVRVTISEGPPEEPEGPAEPDVPAEENPDDTGDETT